jgi:hypothetical protein
MVYIFSKYIIMGNIINKESIRMTLLSKDKAVEALRDAEDVDEYQYLCENDTLNSISRRNCNYSPNNFTNDEYDKCIEYCSDIVKLIPSKLKNDIGEVKLVYLFPSADGGMPHTRYNNIICFTNFSQLYSIQTLIHELWHIHQKKYKYYWHNVLNDWGWTQYNGQLSDHVANKVRYNPDTIDSPFWIFNNKWIPLPIFQNITQPKINEVNIIFYNPNTDFYTTQVPYEMIQYFSYKVPISAYEHPMEMAAYMLSDHTNYNDVPAFNKLLTLIGRLSIYN